MSLAILYSRANQGVQAPLVTVEVHLSGGVPGISIVGLPATAVKESKDRVRGAIINSHFDFPIRHITINLAPAELPKEGGAFDLAIALGILAASGQIPKDNLMNYEFLGELALSGALRPVRGCLTAALAAKRDQRQVIYPQQNAEVACLADKVTVYLASHLLEVTAHLTETASLSPLSYRTPHPVTATSPALDMIDVKGQLQAKRALEVAAAGGHSLLMTGPPGSGKSMLASRLITILPELTEQESMDVASIYSLSSQEYGLARWRTRPFRAPHHTASAIALIGGGRPPQPGEVSLAHHGVLFLDEFPEFNRPVLEVLREPLETGQVTITRAAYQADFPAAFQLIAAMNPCPCGYFGDPARCHCSPDMVRRYQAKLSGPLLDRIDMQIRIQPLNNTVLMQPVSPDGEASAAIRARVSAAMTQQYHRQQALNSRLSQQNLYKHCILEEDAHAFAVMTMDKLNLSARGYHRLLKVSRTIADLAQSDTIKLIHLQEGLSYRQLNMKEEIHV